MTISLSGINLPKDLEWQDEFAWTPVRQSQEISLSGALIIEEAAQLKGRPITLVGGDNACWVPRSTITALQALAQTADQVMTLDYHGTDYSVRWRHSEIPIDTKQVARIMNPDPDHKYTISLKLIETA